MVKTVNVTNVNSCSAGPPGDYLVPNLFYYLHACVLALLFFFVCPNNVSVVFFCCCCFLEMIIFNICF